MFRSATFKLTMYYLLIIAVISVGFSTALYHVAVNDLAFGLQRQTQRISDNFPVFSDSPYLRLGAEIEESRQHLIGRLVLCNVLVLIAAGFASYALARRTLQPIEKAHERQKRFTADVSHELRTPLTALKMESEVALLDSAATKDELRAVVKSNIEEVEKLTLLTGNLLKLSQLDNPEHVSPHSRLVLQDIVSAAAKQAQTVASERSITVQYKPGAVVEVLGEPSTLTQLFVILLDNAIKYGSNDSTIRVNDGKQHNYATVTITDEGTGIAKPDLEHVFERFYRADEARGAANSGGFGIGLSIAKLIADNHNATITLRSKVGKGTTATVLIPIAGQLPAKKTSQA